MIKEQLATNGSIGIINGLQPLDVSVIQRSTLQKPLLQPIAVADGEEITQKDLEREQKIFENLLALNQKQFNLYLDGNFEKDNHQGYYEYLQRVKASVNAYGSMYDLPAEYQEAFRQFYTKTKRLHEIYKQALPIQRLRAFQECFEYQYACASRPPITAPKPQPATRWYHFLAFLGLRPRLKR